MNVFAHTKKILAGGFIAGCMMMVSTTTLTGCLTDSKKDSVVVTPTKVDSVKSMDVNVGAQENATLGSFVNLTNYSVLKLTAAEAASASVDLIFAYSGTASSSAVYSPDAAKAGIAGGAGLTIAQGLTTANHTELKTINAAKFDALVTKAGLDSLYASGVVDASGRLLVSTGFAFAAKSASGKIVAMKISSVTTSATGAAVITGKAMW